MCARRRHLVRRIPLAARNADSRRASQTGTCRGGRLPNRCRGVNMFAALHGSGNLRALAFEFSPVVEQTAPDTVTFDASGLDRLFGPVQDIAAAVMRRAGETGVTAHLALAANADASICAA